MYGKGKVVPLDRSTDALISGSHKQICVKCTRCNEVFTREFRYINQLHNCPTHITKNGVDMKWCNKCEQFLDNKNFSKNQYCYDGVRSYCTKCTRETSKKKLHTFDNWLKHHVAQKRYHCTHDGIKFNLTFDYLKDLWDKQNGKCAYSLVELIFDSTSLCAAQLDRIVPSRGYVKGNVAWVSKGMDYLKSNHAFNDFGQYLSEINCGHVTPVRMEVKLIHPDAKPPLRKRTTDAGYDIASIEDVIIPAHGMHDVHTGIIVASPPGHYLTVDGRSGMARKGVMPFRGIIDATYCGELMVALMNISDIDYKVSKYDRIAQIIAHKQIHLDFVEVEKFGPDYDQRGTAGFGSSGV